MGRFNKGLHTVCDLCVGMKKKQTNSFLRPCSFTFTHRISQYVVSSCISKEFRSSDTAMNTPRYISAIDVKPLGNISALVCDVVSHDSVPRITSILMVCTRLSNSSTLPTVDWQIKKLLGKSDIPINYYPSVVPLFPEKHNWPNSVRQHERVCARCDYQ